MVSGFVVQLRFFDGHVLKFAGLEDFPALQAFNKFGIFVAGDDLYTRVLTLIHLASLLGNCNGGIEVIYADAHAGRALGRREMPEIGGILALPVALSSPFGINTRSRFGCCQQTTDPSSLNSRKWPVNNAGDTEGGSERVNLFIMKVLRLTLRYEFSFLGLQRGYLTLRMSKELGSMAEIFGA